ncbi:cupin domain-containing protein [Agreia pratensis]|uniref:(S)-ureidoglycine aminohydrolase cupin domain-containing protein n=1 Tax=Agreia pratensis TaxID=150121 RepID=A0A1X7ISK6_9MICO|nr:cupin domain-containing protein [Agreia pratensis]SMG17898.1 hypothetical protein SAMN06296010_0827 [Agreia pratensis]
MVDSSTNALQPGGMIDALALSLDLAPADNVVAGTPHTGFYELMDTDGRSVGIWELGVGTVTDTEIDEVFVVISGSATVEFDDSDETLSLRPGSVGRLGAGMRTRWTVTETLRKIYIT